MPFRSRLALLLALVAWSGAGLARAPTSAERREILDSVRPEAAVKADQPVRIRVDLLNVDSDWAILVGDLVGQPGQPMVWSAERNCDPNYGHGLWAVLNRVDGGWRVKHLDICVVEPVYWDLSPYGGTVWPCGVYAGMSSVDGQDIEALCRSRRTRPRKP